MSILIMLALVSSPCADGKCPVPTVKAVSRTVDCECKNCTCENCTCSKKARRCVRPRRRIFRKTA